MKAQVSTELIFAIGMILLFFTVLIHFSLDKKTERIDATKELGNRLDCNKVMINSIGSLINNAGKNVSVNNLRVNSESRFINSEYICILPSGEITNSSGASIFNISGNTRVKNGQW